MLDYKYVCGVLMKHRELHTSIFFSFCSLSSSTSAPRTCRRTRLRENRFSGISHIDAEKKKKVSFNIPTSKHMNRRRLLISTALFSYMLYGMALISVKASSGVELKDNLILTKRTESLLHSSHRKMLLVSHEKEDKTERRAEPDRIGEKCQSTDIVVNQAATEPMPNGIPGYTVEITNQCMSGCKISRIHISCGWFSSAKLINPRVFKRIHYDDCLVNNGKPLPYGSTLSFHYANTFPYPLSVSFVTCS